MEYRALALDLDGTLTDSNKQITAYTKEILGEAMVRGVKVILASGRPVLGIQSVAVALGLEERGGYILAYNGGQIVDCGTGRVIFEKLVPTKYFSDICAIARSFGAQPLTYSEDMVVAESEADLYVQKEAYNNSAAVRVVERVDCAIRQPVPKYMVVGENDKLKQVRECMKKSFEGKLDVFFSEPYFLEVVAVGFEKGT
ncbi:MAG: HAD hydrolase family protein, partial [Lachnospiraceae bacterium]|nr:HAD hydrolase family protein [Lachnospiraceae bacterium]